MQLGNLSSEFSSASSDKLSMPICHLGFCSSADPLIIPRCVSLSSDSILSSAQETVTSSYPALIEAILH